MTWREGSLFLVKPGVASFTGRPTQKDTIKGGMTKGWQGMTTKEPRPIKRKKRLGIKGL
jgi:hypothetical protein